MRTDATDWNWAWFHLIHSLATCRDIPEALCRCICIWCVSKRMRHHLDSANSSRKMKTKTSMQTIGLIPPTGKINPHFSSSEFSRLCSLVWVRAVTEMHDCIGLRHKRDLHFSGISILRPKRGKTKILFSVRFRATCNWHIFHWFSWLFFPWLHPTPIPDFSFTSSQSQQNNKTYFLYYLLRKQNLCATNLHRIRLTDWRTTTPEIDLISELKSIRQKVAQFGRGKISSSPGTISYSHLRIWHWNWQWQPLDSEVHLNRSLVVNGVEHFMSR